MSPRCISLVRGRLLFTLFLLCLLITFCEEPERIVKLVTLDAVSADISYSSATLKGEIVDLGSSEIEEFGILISKNSMFISAEPVGQTIKATKGPFQIQFTGLEKNTTYFFKAYVKIAGTPVYSNVVKQFTTKPSEAPVVTAGTITNTAMTSATLNGEVTSDGGEAVTKRGLCWSVNPTPVVSSDTTACGSGTGTFSGNLKNLTPGTQYYVRTFAINAKGTSYSPADIVFTTHNYPAVTTTAVTAITNTGAASGGNVTSEGGVAVSARGVVWGTTAGPTIELPTKTSDGTGAGTFASTLAGLTPGASYFIRAYATNKYGTSYGTELQLTATKPSDVTTMPVETIGNTTAKIKGSVNPNGFAANVFFEYGTTALYGLLANAVPSPVSGSSAVTVSADLTGLLPGTEYHYRIKAVNSGGTSTGSDVTFKTTDSPLPVTGSANTITNTAAVLTGSVNANGSSTSVSFELGTTTSYGTVVTATPGTVTGNSSTTVTGNATGLLQGTLYHYRVKAVSVGGTTYGNDITFTTTRPPDATTSAATSVLNTSANLNGIVNPYDLSTNVTFEYGESTAYGTSVNAAESPVSGSSSVSVSKTITGLNPGKTYHFRVKAESSAGAVYGNDLTFKTPEPPLATTDVATTVGNTIATLNGTVNAKDLSATVSFQYGLTTSYGTTVNATPGTVNGSSATAVSYSLTGLNPGTTYHFRVVATSSGGTANGSDQTFTTTEPPVAVTGSASSIAATTVTIGGTVNAKELTTAVSFEYGTTTSYGQTAAAAESPVSGSANTSVSAAITSLTAATTYHFRVKATSATGTAYGDDVTFTTTDVPLTVTDIDGNVYNTVQIGTQLWMKENLKVTHYSNGDPVPNMTTATWNTTTNGAYSIYSNTAANKDIYGALYNLFTAIDVRNICPAGWYAPSDNDLSQLSTYLGGSTVAGGKMKETGTSHWTSPNTGATNESGFTALPNGHKDNASNFANLGSWGSWWSTTLKDADNYWSYNIGSASASLNRSYNQKNTGLGIRCIKGNLPISETTLATLVTSTTCTLNGKINPNGSLATVVFEYGTSIAYGNSINAIQSPVSGTAATIVNADVTGLAYGTTYHYRVVATTSGITVYGADKTFTTLNPPSISILPAIGVSHNAALLQGTVNPNGYSTTIKFEYGLNTSYGSEVAATQSPLTGSAATPVSASLSVLSPSTTYHFRVKAENSGGISYGDDQTLTTLATPTTVSDYDGNVYNVVKIGTQYWFQENLKTTHYNDGTLIPLVTSNASWLGASSAAMCWWVNNISNKDIYGGMYNWHVSSDPIYNPCPTGWHVPTESEFNLLIEYLGGTAVAGGKMKEIGSDYWNSPNVADNSSGFSARGAGYRASDGGFGGLKDYGPFWSATKESPGTNPPTFQLGYGGASFGSHTLAPKTYGYSLRCMKGEAFPIEASSITALTATLNGKVNANGMTSTVTFEYGQTTSYGTIINATQNPVTGTSLINVNANISGLTPARTYHYRIKMVNSDLTVVSDDKTFTTNAAFPLSAGDYYAGGIVFYVDGTGQHGMVAAEYDQVTGTAWAPNGYGDTSIPTYSEFGKGDLSTQSIVSISGAGNYAAGICDALVLNGYSDWFLPTKDELNVLYQNLGSLGIGNFSSDLYWSSTQGPTYQFAYNQRLTDGITSSSSKYSGSCVFSCIRIRAVRKF